MSDVPVHYYFNQLWAGQPMPYDVRMALCHMAGVVSAPVFLPEWYEADPMYWGEEWGTCPQVHYFFCCMVLSYPFSQCGRYEAGWEQGPSGWGWQAYTGRNPYTKGFYSTTCCSELCSDMLSLLEEEREVRLDIENDESCFFWKIRSRCNIINL